MAENGKPRPPDRSRRVYAYWAAAMAFLALLGILCWFVGVPVLKTRAAVLRCAADRDLIPEEITELGGSEVALARLRFYLRLPERLAPKRPTAVRMIAACGPDARPLLYELCRHEDDAVRAAALGSLGKSIDYDYDSFYRFGPVDLVETSDYILLLELSPPDAADKVRAKVSRVIKGVNKAPQKELFFDLSVTTMKAHAAKAASLIAAQGDGPALFFAGHYDDGQIACLHLDGEWLSLDGAGLDTWDFARFDNQMEATWDSGTDMLLRLTELIIKYPEIGVPYVCGVEWKEPHLKPGRVPGRVSEMHAVPSVDGKPARFHIASGEGDRLYRYHPKIDWIVDETERLNFEAKSLAAAWADFDADGRPDLASWDGKTLSLHLRGEHDTFKPGTAATLISCPSSSICRAARQSARRSTRSGFRPSRKWESHGTPRVIRSSQKGVVRDFPAVTRAPSTSTPAG